MSRYSSTYEAAPTPAGSSLASKDLSQQSNEVLSPLWLPRPLVTPLAPFPSPLCTLCSIKIPRETAASRHQDLRVQLHSHETASFDDPDDDDDEWHLVARIRREEGEQRFALAQKEAAERRKTRGVMHESVTHSGKENMPPIQCGWPELGPEVSSELQRTVGDGERVRVGPVEPNPVEEELREVEGLQMYGFRPSKMGTSKTGTLDPQKVVQGQ